MANRQSVGRMFINPKAKPLDEVWRFLKACVDVWLSKMKIYSYSKELMEDLETDALCESYRYLVTRVVDGTYRRDLSFYLNCRSAAWTGCKSAADKFGSRKKKDEALCSIYDNISDSNVRIVDSLVGRNLMTESDWQTLYKERGKAYKPATRKDAVERQRWDEYFRYIEDCVELGVEAVKSFEEFTKSEQPGLSQTLEPQDQSQGRSTSPRRDRIRRKLNVVLHVLRIGHASTSG